MTARVVSIIPFCGPPDNQGGTIMAQSVCFTGSIRGLRGSFITFEDHDELATALWDLQSSVSMLDALYAQIEDNNWLICPSDLHRALDTVLEVMHQHLASVDFYVHQLDLPAGRVIERDEGWPGGQAPVVPEMPIEK